MSLISRNYKPLALSALLAASISLTHTPVFAETYNVETPDTVDFEPTTVEELGGSEQSYIPGTDPLYDEGVTVTQVQILGNNTVPDMTIMNALETQPGTMYNKKRLKKDLENIYALGYFTDKLRAVPVATKDGIHVRFEVEENPIMKGFKIQGNTVMTTEELAALVDAQAGLPQNITAINAGIKAIEKAYQDKGYVLARVEGIDEDDDGNVILNVAEGKINDIDFQGNTKTKDFVLKRAMAQKAGEIYNEKTVAEDMKRIFSTQTVSDVRRVVKASADKPGEYDLVIETDEKKTGTVSFGGGADSASGIFLSGGYSDPNWIGRGYNVSATGLVGTGVIGANSQIVSRRSLQFQLGFFNPSFYGTENSIGSNVYARDFGSFNIPLGLERRIGGTLSWARPLKSWGNTTVSSELGVESINIREGSDLAYLNSNFGPTARNGSAPLTATQRDNMLDDGTYVYLNPSIVHDTRNNRFNPNHGHLYSVMNRFGLGLSNNTYSSLFLNLRRYLRVTDDITFALNGQTAVNYLGSIPEFNQFRLGGAYNVRGFQEGGMGTGEHFVMGSAELRTKVPFLKKFKKYPIYDMVQAAFFADAGKLFDRPATNDFFNRPGYGVSVGAGLRVNLPLLGPIRIDYAVPIVGKGNNINNFNFGVGQKF